jgi:hypothetical protein
MRYLIDTNIIIYYLNGDKQAISFIDTNLHQCAISTITYLEVLVFPYSDTEDKKIRKFLELFTIYDVSRNIIDRAIQSYRTKKIKMADNLIGATAKVHNLSLVTRNVSDFAYIDLEIINPYT